MPFVAGPRLDRVLDDRQRLDAPADPADDARAIRRVAATLQHIHDRGVLHQDLRPANLAMGGRGEVWVMNLAMPAAGDADAMEGSATTPRSGLGASSTSDPRFTRSA